jgi:hypothetical protein
MRIAGLALANCFGAVLAGTRLRACSSTFPIVVKDRFSARWKGDRVVLGSVAYAYAKDDIRGESSRPTKTVGRCVLIQQFVAAAVLDFLLWRPSRASICRLM